MSMTKRILSLLLALTLLLSNVPAVAFATEVEEPAATEMPAETIMPGTEAPTQAPAEAPTEAPAATEGEETYPEEDFASGDETVATEIIEEMITDEAALATTHSHPICGSRCACASSSHSNQTWQEWDGTTKMYNGYYYLTKDVVLTSTINLDYSYTSYLCLNGYSITCDTMVFNVYTLRSLLITDCKGTGRIESSGSSETIRNNNHLTIWGGTIVNNYESGWSVAINANPNSITTVLGGKIQAEMSAFYADVGATIDVRGGTVLGSGSSGNAIYGDANVKISGGRLEAPQYQDAIALYSGDFTMSGGYVDGHVTLYNVNSEETSAVTITGGTIDGQLSTGSNAIVNISGGDMNISLSTDSTISAGTFRGNCYLGGGNNTISAGNFTNASLDLTGGQTWICGGSYSDLYVAVGAKLYLSGVPDIGTLHILDAGAVSAQNLDGSGSFGGETVPVYLSSNKRTWKNGDIVIKDVKSDAVAQKFTLIGSGSEWMYLERVNNNLVLRVLPHG